MIGRPKRKAIPDRVKLAVVLAKLGLKLEQVQFDHTPALALRPVNDSGTDYEPAQLDPVHIQLLTLEQHKRKTVGTHVPLSGDISLAAKSKRLEKGVDDFRARLLAKAEGEPKPQSKWPKRPFKRRKT